MLQLHALESVINTAWENRSDIGTDDARDGVTHTLALLDQGRIRVAEKLDGSWHVHQWIKKAILLSFRFMPNRPILGAPGNAHQAGCWYDKVDSKFASWDGDAFLAAKIRNVPGSFVRHSAHIEPNVILMPSFVNVGAYVGEGTMIDTWSTIGSCAQIGKNCHISGGVGIGGVLEPLQANPVIIEDGAFVGARSEIAEGVIVEEGAVISMGVFIGASTKIVDRDSGEVIYGRVPAYSVVVPGTLPPKDPSLGGPSLSCAVIIKRVDARTRAKTSLNELLRF